MLTTIQLNDQFRLETDEIRNLRSERMLPAESKSIQLSAAQVKLQPLLGISLVATQLSGFR